MNRRELISIAVAGAIAGVAPAALEAADTAGAADALRPPVTPKRPKRIEQLGRVRVDDYAWLKDPQWKTVWRDPSVLQPDIRKHLEDENRYADAVLKPTEALQASLFAQMQARIRDDQASPPRPDGAWAYYQYFRSGADHAVHARKPRGGGTEQILFDEDERSRGKEYYRVINGAHSPDHALFAWAEDEVGAERFRIRVRDLKTGEILSSAASDAYGDFAFSPDSQWIFWTWRDEFSRPAKVFRRPARGGEDVEVYEEKDPAMFMTVGRTASNGFVTITVWGPDTSEVRLIAAATPTAAPVLVEARAVGIHYEVNHWDGRLVILTNADGATDSKLMWASPADPSRRAWKEWVPHRPGHYTIETYAFENHFVRIERVDANLQVIISERGSLKEHSLPFADVAYDVHAEPDQEFASATLRVVYQTPSKPPQWVEWNLAASGARKVLQTQAIGGGFNAANYTVQRLFAPASDGQQVPLTVLMKRGAALNGSAPLLLYAYGSYGVPSEAEFSVPNLTLVDQGWIYAIAHVRGGSEKGRGWFLDGRRFKKKNTFTDFIACADYLCEKRYTRKKHIVAHGLSAGGLLMGAITNMRPDLWAGVIAQVPFVDMLNTMSDAEHPLVPVFRPDWGDPLADKEAYDYIASIAPYENVSRQAYPPVLATTSVRDDRVGYWEAAKWVAALREKSTSGAPVLLKINMIAGHQGGAGRSDTLKQMAMFYAFAQWAVGRSRTRDARPP
ncbi:MAG: S9 family peptidase [Gammaproteobacteria bacterium]